MWNPCPVADWFSTLEAATGYATARPPVHAQVVAEVQRRWGATPKWGVALDVGCGAGLSTRALAALAERCVGVDPSAAMVACARRSTAGTEIVRAAAEALPFTTDAFESGVGRRLARLL